MKQPVRGGLKGGRRSVKRGQSVEFADYRDYALGDDLRQLDWNVLRPPREAVRQAVRRGGGRHDHVPRSTPARRWPSGDPRSCCSRSGRRRRSGTSGSRPRTGSSSRALTRADRPAPGRRCAAPGACSGCWPTCRRSSRPTGPTDLVASARHAAAMLSGRGVVVLLSDLLDPAADRVIRELAATGSELIVLHLLSPDELDPRSRATCGSSTARRARASTSPSTSPRSTTTRRGSPRGRRASPTSPPSAGASYVPLSTDVPLADLVFAELRRRRVVG